MPWEIIDDTERVKPLFANMETAFNDYVSITKRPIPTGPTNQCAIRMSIALGRCGFLIQGIRDLKVFTSGDVTLPYVDSAEELSDYLRKCWGRPTVFKTHKQAIATKLGGKKGVVFFNNVFTREGSDKKEGDHIDLWNGTHYYNDIIHIGAGKVSADPRGSYFGESEWVAFHELA